MEAIAIAKHIRQSPKKVRFVLDAVRGKKVNEALNTLEFMNKKAAGHILKTLKSAIANMSVKSDEYDHESLKIKEAFVDEGPVMKRWRAAAMGRATQILKRNSHLTIVITDGKN
jgi:large subunit ribosomal protein L22